MRKIVAPAVLLELEARSRATRRLDDARRETRRGLFPRLNPLPVAPPSTPVPAVAPGHHDLLPQLAPILVPHRRADHLLPRLTRRALEVRRVRADVVPSSCGFENLGAVGSRRLGEVRRHLTHRRVQGTARLCAARARTEGRRPFGHIFSCVFPPSSPSFVRVRAFRRRNGHGGEVDQPESPPGSACARALSVASEVGGGLRRVSC